MGRFGQVIAVDRKFELFQRAWCVAEIAEAQGINPRAARMPAFLQVASVESIEQNFEEIEEVDIRHCQASRAEDKEGIMMRIDSYTNVELFNADLRRNIKDIIYGWVRRDYEKLRKESIDDKYTIYRQELEMDALRSEVHTLRSEVSEYLFQ